MTIKIIGAGFGRTGTTSLKAALEALGFVKCHHMKEVIFSPRQSRFWRDISEGQAVDWDTVLAGYQATVDWPACSYYRELLAAYPEAKVLLTVRDPARWYQSAYDTVYQASLVVPRWLRWVNPQAARIFQMQQNVIWQGDFQGQFADKDYAIAAFNQHIEAVKQAVPPEKLLIYQVQEGWGPLCQFLEVPVPADQPFPHLNDTAEFRRIVRGMQVLGWLPWGLVMGLGVLLGWWLWRGRCIWQ